MTVHYMNQMFRTPFGRIVNFLLILGILNLSSCTVYKPAETSMSEIRTNQQVLDNLDVYRFFVHDGQNSYLLKNPSFNAEGNLSGTLVLTDYVTPDEGWTLNQKKEYWKEHKYDINIYSNTPFSNLRADLVSTTPEISHTVTITGAMVDKMTITSIDMERQTSDGALIILGVLAMAVIVVLIVILLGAAEDGGDGSGSASGSD